MRASLEVDSSYVKRLVKVEAEGKTVKLLKQWVSEAGETDLDLLVLKDIREICGATPPFHPLSGERIVNLCKKYGQQYPPDYATFWNLISAKALATLADLHRFLNLQTK